MNLPTFIIAGTAKAATTSLYAYLDEHPEIYMSPVKETRFFAFEPSNPDHIQAGRDRFPIRTLSEYGALFDDVAGQFAIGEASPQYIFSDHARRGIREVMPNIQLIFSLRHPVERIYSLHQMNVRNGRDTRHFSKMIREDVDRLTKYKYSRALSRWFADFDAKQIHVLLFRDLKHEPQIAVQKVLKFLSVDSDFVPSLETKHNVGGVPQNAAIHRVLQGVRRSKFAKNLIVGMPSTLRKQLSQHMKGLEVRNLRRPERIDDGDAQFLLDLFAEDNYELEELLGRNLDTWREIRSGT